MNDGHEHERALQPDDLSRFVVERLNAGDVDGLVALYGPDAVLAKPDGQIAVGSNQIREAYQNLLTNNPSFTPGQQLPTIRNGDLALTATRLPEGGVTVEIARRQTDGTWLWVIDQPNLLQ